MQHVSDATFDDFVQWYLEREVRNESRKGRREDEKKALSGTPDKQREVMQERHGGKLRDWFEQARWSIQLLTAPAELECLMILKKQTWDGITWPMPRLLGEAANRIRQERYFDPPGNDNWGVNYIALRDHRLLLQGKERLVLITPSEAEMREEPSTTFYLHDGLGRALPYLAVVMETSTCFCPVEAFIAKER